MDLTSFTPNGHKYITNLIKNAISNGEHTASVTGKWLIDQAIRIPSNFTLILDGCYLVLADNCYSNVFINENHDTISYA